MTNDIVRSLQGKLIVSCQAAEGEPLSDLNALTRVAESVLLGGAGGLRAEGAERVAAFRKITQLPIIGLVKTFDPEGNVYITPNFRAAESVSAAGADIVALDCTQRRLTEAEPWPALIEKIRSQLGSIVCADIATLDDALAAQGAGADIVATTLRGYTADTAGVRSVDWSFLEALVGRLQTPVVLEGHVTHPDEVARAMDLGVHAVVVGSAITRPQLITARFVAATSAQAKSSPEQPLKACIVI